MPSSPLKTSLGDHQDANNNNNSEMFGSGSESNGLPTSSTSSWSAFDVSYLDAISDSHSALPEYHPRVLIECLMAGWIERMGVILKHLYNRTIVVVSILLFAFCSLVFVSFSFFLKSFLCVFCCQHDRTREGFPISREADLHSSYVFSLPFLPRASLPISSPLSAHFSPLPLFRFLLPSLLISSSCFSSDFFFPPLFN
jgi:hypothetical protein